MTEHRIAVIPGDGIGREVMPEGVRVMEAAAARHGVRFKWQEFPWSCDWYKAHGRMCPEDAAETLRRFDAVYFGAVGNPALVPDHVAVWGLLINFRRWFDLYVNLRPVRLFEGLPCPLAGRKPGDIDYVVVRENTEGEYGNVGGRLFENTPNEMAVQQSVFSRRGVDRILRYAFELARTRKKHVTSCTKSNGISITMPYWDERVKEMAARYPHPIIAREGWPFLGLGVAVSLLIQFFLGFLFAIPFCPVTVFVLQFFRDPPREVPEDPRAVLSPADGRIVSVEKARDPYLERDAIKVSVFMNVFNVHSNRAPVDGTVRKRWYHPGSFLNAALDKASLENERNALWLRTRGGADVTCVQIAGLVARRVLCYVGEGAELARGQRFGFIRFGSRVDVYLPPDAQVKAALGDKVYATESVLAWLTPPS